MIIRAYKSLFPYLSRYRNRYIIGIICLIIVDAAQFYGVILLTARPGA
jgi:hypothetical protein